MITNIIEKSKALLPDMIAWRRHLHQIPELGNELPKTTAYVKEQLDLLGIPYTNYMDGNAMVAIIEGKPGPNAKTLGLRADMDALPLPEATGLPFAATNGLMHACGHDGHTAMLLGTGKLLMSERENFTGRVALIFQPGEEYPGGAEPMIKEGALRDAKVDYIAGIHEGQLITGAESGKILWRSGALMAAPDRFLITINGLGSHGAYPEVSKDPVVAAGQLIVALQTIKSRNIKASEPVVLSITRVTGGFNQNILPDKVELEGTVRTLDPEVRKFVADRMKTIAEGIAAAMDVKVDITYEFKYPALINDAEFTQKAITSLEELFPAGTLVEMKDALMGGEDFSYFLQEVPGAFFFLQNPGAIGGVCYAHHNPKFDVDEGLFYMGPAIFSKLANTFLTE